MNAPFIADRTFVNEDFTSSRLEKGDYENCVFEGWLFKEGYLDNQNFMECEFVNCDLTNSNIKHTIFKETSFKGCKLTGLRFEECNHLLLSIRFEDCNMTLTSFNGLALKGTFFSNCILQESDFTDSDLSFAQLPYCNLKKAIFENTVLHQTDFTESIEIDIDPALNQLKKTKFSKENVIGLLKKYDIVVT